MAPRSRRPPRAPSMLRRWSSSRQVGLCDPQVNPQCTAASDWPCGGRLRLLSFNIQVGINTQRYHHYLTRSWQHLLPHNGRAGNLQRIGDLLADYDLVALQEVDGGSLRSGYVNQVEHLAHLGAFPYWYQQLNRNLGRLAQHSNGVLSRLRPSLLEDHPLPGPRDLGLVAPQIEATFPSWRPQRCLDHILLSPGLALERFEVLALPISDHLPVAVEIRLHQALGGLQPAGSGLPARDDAQ